jgi:hypothetical protein
MGRTGADAAFCKAAGDAGKAMRLSREGDGADLRALVAVGGMFGRTVRVVV